MPDGYRDKKLVYHMTALENLPSIASIGLLPRAELLRRGLVHCDVADHEILEGRAALGLEERVPFHFMAKSPFQYGVVRSKPKTPFVLLGYWRSDAAGNGWKIVPRHPLNGDVPYQILDWEEGMDAIEWHYLDQYPRDWAGDRDCKAVCMAEALAPGVVPWADIGAVICPSEDSKAAVLDMLESAQVPDRLWVNDQMFPKGCK